MTAMTGPPLPAAAPMQRRPGAPRVAASDLLERNVFASIAGNLASMLGVGVVVAPGSVVAARWEMSHVEPLSPWAVARLEMSLDGAPYPAVLWAPLDAALEWGAICLRRPRGSLEQPRVGPDGTVLLTDVGEQDFLAYAEVCNVVSGGTLARTLRAWAGRPFHIMVKQVLPGIGSAFAEELDPSSVVFQGVLRYPGWTAPVKGAPPAQCEVPVLLAVPEALSAALFLQNRQGRTPDVYEALLQTGMWR